jgi:hypothetical protein
VFEAQPNSCVDVENAPVFYSESDVSKRNGVRCKGSGCDYNPPADNIDQLEMNFSMLGGPVYHWSKPYYPLESCQVPGPTGLGVPSTCPCGFRNQRIVKLIISTPALYKDRGRTMVGCKHSQDPYLHTDIAEFELVSNSESSGRKHLRKLHRIPRW